MSTFADCGAGSCSSDTECDDQYIGKYHQRYPCSYDHGSYWNTFFDYGPNYSCSPWPSHGSLKHKTSPWNVTFSPYYQSPRYDAPTAYSAPEAYDSFNLNNSSKVCDSNRTYQEYDTEMHRHEPTAFLEEHHVVHGNSRRNGPYTHENYRIDNEDGSYHGHYLWDANRPYMCRHIYSGSCGVERNSLQDVYYEDEAEYNLDEPFRHSESTLCGGSFKKTKKRSKNNSRRREKRESSETSPATKGWNQEDWRNEYHYVRGEGVAVYREESTTDGVALARAWMKMDLRRENPTW